MSTELKRRTLAEAVAPPEDGVRSISIVDNSEMYGPPKQPEKKPAVTFDERLDELVQYARLNEPFSASGKLIQLVAELAAEVKQLKARPAGPYAALDNKV